MFTGGSQFALVGVLGAGGGVVAAVLTAWLLGARNSIYALSLAPVLTVTGPAKLAAAQLTIDESTAMALSHPAEPRAARHAFWSTGIAVFVLWNIGTLIGALGATWIGDPATLGLDAAIPAAFVALLWPRLVDRTMWAVALAGAAVALVLTPVLQPGLPVLAAGLVALVGRRTDGPGPMIWVAVLAGSLGCYVEKLLGYALPRSVHRAGVGAAGVGTAARSPCSRRSSPSRRSPTARTS